MRQLALIAAFAAVSLLCAPLAAAEELSVDAKAFETSGAGAKPVKQNKRAKAPASAAAKPGAKTPDRQFGELEGWSPGKAPPGAKEAPDDKPAFKQAPVNISPSGGMAVGMPF